MSTRLCCACVAVLLLPAMHAAPLAARPPADPAPQWTPVTLPDMPLGLTAKGNTLWVCGDHAMIADSTDGGHTWTVKNRDSHGEMLLSIAFADDKTGYAFGADGTRWSTTDGGETWQSSKSADAYPWIQAIFFDANTGFAISPTEFAATTNAGTSWVFHGIPLPGAAESGSESSPAAGAKGQAGGERGGREGGRGGRGGRGMVAHLRIRQLAAMDAKHAVVIFAAMPGQARPLAATVDGQHWNITTFPPTVDIDAVVASGGRFWLFGSQNNNGTAAPVVASSADGASWTVAKPLAYMPYECVSNACRVAGGWTDYSGAQPVVWSLPGGDRPFRSWAAVGNTFCAVASDLECVQAGPNYTPPAGGGLERFEMGAPDAPHCQNCKPIAATGQLATERHTGQVFLQGALAPDGSLRDVSVVAAPFDDTARLALDGVKKWRFDPPSGPKTIEIEMTVNIFGGGGRGMGGGGDDMGGGGGGRGGRGGGGGGGGMGGGGMGGGGGAGGGGDQCCAIQ